MAKKKIEMDPIQEEGGIVGEALAETNEEMVLTDESQHADDSTEMTSQTPYDHVADAPAPAEAEAKPAGEKPADEAEPAGEEPAEAETVAAEPAEEEPGEGETVAAESGETEPAGEPEAPAPRQPSYRSVMAARENERIAREERDRERQAAVSAEASLSDAMRRKVIMHGQIFGIEEIELGRASLWARLCCSKAPPKSPSPLSRCSCAIP